MTFNLIFYKTEVRERVRRGERGATYAELHSRIIDYRTYTEVWLPFPASSGSGSVTNPVSH